VEDEDIANNINERKEYEEEFRFCVSGSYIVQYADG